MGRDDRRREPGKEEFQNHISFLVQTAVEDKTVRGLEAQESILQALRVGEQYLPLLIVEKATDTLVFKGGDVTVHYGCQLIDQVLSEAEKLDRYKNAAVKVTPQVTKTIEGILVNSSLLAANPNFLRMQSERHKRFVDEVLPSVKKQIDAGSKTVHISFSQNAEVVEPGKVLIKIDGANLDGQGRRLLEQWSIWSIALAQTSNNDSIIEDSELRDYLVDLLRTEPDVESYTHLPPLFIDKYGDISLADIDQMGYPLSEEEYKRVTEYVIGISSVDRNNVRYGRLGTIDMLFSAPNVFHGLIESKKINNKRILAVINSWQEQFLWNFIFGSEQQDIEEQTKRAVQALPSYVTDMLLVAGLPIYVTRPHVANPYYSVGNLDLYINLMHPFVREALRRIWEQPDFGNQSFMSSDLIAREYYMDTVLPALKKRAAAFGKAGELREVIAVLEKEMSEKEYSKNYIRELRETFEYMCGKEFLERLGQHSQELTEVAQSTWDSIFQKDIHYLPIQEGFEILSFSDGSTPEVVGLKDVMVRRIGDPIDWKINFRFNLKAGGAVINGILDKSGNFSCELPLEENVPQLFLLIRHIAILTFHDLVIQEKSEASKKKQKDQGNQDAQENGNVPVSTSYDGVIEIIKSRGGSLPRVQRDTDLIDRVYKITGSAPRRVEIHKMTLQGVRAYLEGIGEYEISVGSDPNDEKYEENLDFYTSWLEETRKVAHQTSKTKRENVPARFQLNWILDPVTGEKRYLETWVVEHTKPKPTEEELHSLIKIFERYYKHSSALASLDQMKPWFIGE